MNNASRMAGALAGAVLACVTTMPAHAATIEPDVAQDLARGGRMNVFVKVASDADLSGAEGMLDKSARRQFVYDTLNAHASASQAALHAWLYAHHVRYLSFWINNSLYLYDVDAALVRELAARSDVAQVRGDHALNIDAAVSQTPAGSAPDTLEWNIEQIHADEVWLHGNMGEGIVVANIDTGVRYTHEALRRQYRGNNGDGTFTHDYNWWDPQHSLAAPADNVGHGTHLMGIAVGGDGLGPQANDIGVAPGARWIAAKGCEQFSCSQLSLISAAQWIACPTKVDGSAPDCTKAPDVVDNGWGGGGGDPWFRSYVNAWRAAGIFATFSVGASGPGCHSIGSPADYPGVIGVGATDMTDALESFSSRGPGNFRPLKPDVVAPGESIRSASNTSDTAYIIFSGTSMANSHVSGTLALVLAAQPAATYAQVYRALAVGAERNLPAPQGEGTCAGRPYNQYPSFIYGWGRVDAEGAVAAITH
jgi:subtilisin family serine protease